MNKALHFKRSLLLLAGMIIFAHAVVPHHHHFDSSYFLQDNLACTNNGPDSKDENHHSHCNAFNLVVSEKIEDDLLNQPASYVHFNIALPHNSIKSLKALISNLTSEAFYVKVPPVKLFFLSTYSFRAPPL